MALKGQNRNSVPLASDLAISLNDIMTDIRVRACEGVSMAIDEGAILRKRVGL